MRTSPDQTQFIDTDFLDWLHPSHARSPKLRANPRAHNAPPLLAPSNPHHMYCSVKLPLPVRPGGLSSHSSPIVQAGLPGFCCARTLGRITYMYPAGLNRTIKTQAHSGSVVPPSHVVYARFQPRRNLESEQGRSLEKPHVPLTSAPFLRLMPENRATRSILHGCTLFAATSTEV